MQRNINQSATSIKILSCIISKLCTFVIKRVHCSYRIPITIQTTNYEKQRQKQIGQNRSTKVFLLPERVLDRTKLASDTPSDRGQWYR